MLVSSHSIMHKEEMQVEVDWSMKLILSVIKTLAHSSSNSMLLSVFS